MTLVCLTLILSLNISAKSILDVVFNDTDIGDEYKDIPVIDKDVYLQSIWAIWDENYDLVDKYIEEGKFHPLWNSPFNVRPIEGVYNLERYPTGYASKQEADEATDRVIRGYRYLISRGDDHSIPVEFGTMSDSSNNMLTSPIGHNNDRIVKFLIEEYGYKKITPFTESSMYANGNLRVFKYLFVESKTLTKIQCEAMWSLEGELSKRFMTGYDENGVKKWKGFMDYWDDLGIPYKHCFSKGDYHWNLYKLDDR